ncbi:unannotated protein [freshwater metagenome]|uniref:Unannotated protein n=1 Tax=freshwater metagenome TaxID=449393 RepID=A0A6J7KTF8_9ZZZZ
MPATATLRLPVREPFDGAGLWRVLDARAVTGLERTGPAGAYVRSLRLPGGAGVVELGLRDGGPVVGRLLLEDAADAGAATGLVRRLLDLDADPAAVDLHLTRDPALAPLVAARPGLRVLGTVDPFELALRAVIGQQVSVAAARTVLGRIVVAHGRALPPGLDPRQAGDGDAGGAAAATGAVEPPLRSLPSPAVVAALPDDALPMPRARAATVRRLAAAVADGTVDLSGDADPAEVVAGLLALPGIGPWTAGYVAMRALGDRDAFPAGDLVLRRSAAALGLPSEARALAAHAERWSPWRSSAAGHLWAAAADAP